MKNLMSKYEHSYLTQLQNILEKGVERNDRTGVGTLAIPFTELVHDWSDGFPLITHRLLNPTSACAEMVCFIRGYTDVREFEARGCKWWRANLNDFNTRWGTPDNLDLGPIYGYKWRNFQGFDQLSWLLLEAKTNPHSRRLMVSAWDPSDQHEAVLPPCHYGFQIFIEDDQLDLLFNMRSVDWMLGCPNDMIAYGFLQLAICRHLGKHPRQLRGNFGDTHVYKNHIEGAEEVLSTLVHRGLPDWTWNEATAPTSMFRLEATDLAIEKCEQGPSVYFPMAV